jgi:hypothetical protein
MSDELENDIEEIIQREHEILQRPLLAEIDALRLENRGLTRQKAEFFAEIERLKVQLASAKRALEVVIQEQGKQFKLREAVEAELGKAQAEFLFRAQKYGVRIANLEALLIGKSSEWEEAILDNNLLTGQLAQCRATLENFVEYGYDRAKAVEILNALFDIPPR